MVIKSKVRLPKKMRPARVKDPVSNSHVVYLKERQTFDVFLSEGHPISKNGEVKVFGDFLELTGVRTVKDGKIYTFSQVGQLENWSSVSTTFLGEVQFTGEKTCSRVCAYLKATNPFKTNIITSINPQNHTLKLSPYQLLEVVVYNPLWGMPLYWEADVSVDPRFEVLSHSYIFPHKYDPAGSVRKINDAFFTYPRATQTTNSQKGFLEYHFWLRCDKFAAKHMMSLPNGCFPDGKIRFLGCIDTNIKVSLDLNIVFNTRETKDVTSERSQIVTFEDSSMEKGVALSPNKKRIHVEDLCRHRNREHDAYTRIGSSSSADWRIYNQETSEWEEYTYQKYSRDWCSEQKFTATQITDPMFQGCKICYLEDVQEDRIQIKDAI